MDRNNSVKGFTLWFTGLSGAGKSTISQAVYMELMRRSFSVELLDGDIIRTNFSKGLGFSKMDRDINIRRIGFISYLLNKHDIISIVAAISPYKETRALNRALIEKYIEIFCDCPIEKLCERDPKGLYKKARAGEIMNFTGISDPYERPENPDLVLETSKESKEESFNKAISYLESEGYILPREGCILRDYTKEDEFEIRRRLVSLGFAEKI
jgi:adenylylsulfate kinase